MLYTNHRYLVKRNNEQIELEAYEESGVDRKASVHTPSSMAEEFNVLLHYILL
jgi:hypothetical protein